MKNKHIYIYYLILLLLLFFRDSDSAPSFVVRMGYLLAFFLPLVTWYRNLFSSCLICFMTISIYGFAYNYFPYNAGIYLIILLMSLLLGGNPTIKFNPIFVVFILFIVIRDFVDVYTPHNLFYSACTVGLFSSIHGSNKSDIARKMAVAFTIISLVLSSMYFLNYNRFIEDYNVSENLERSGWTDPNYLSCIIGMGVLSAFILLVSTAKRGILLVLYCTVVVVISVIAQVLLASRGGILSIVVSLCILIFTSKLKFSHKLFIVLLLACFAFCIISSDYVLLLEHRIQNDVGGGSGRLDIWQNKLTEYMNCGNPLKWIFGFGNISAFRLTAVGDGFVGFHNDYLAFLCAYGLIGFGMFIYILLYPLKISNKQNRYVVISLLSYLMVCSLTLEPLSAGDISYIAFYYMILTYAAEGTVGNNDKKHTLYSYS